MEVNEGENAIFNVEATGSNLTYQWQKSTDNGSNWTDLVGVTGVTCTIANTTTAMNGEQYRCIVTDANDNSVTSNTAILTVNARQDSGGSGSGYRYYIITATAGEGGSLSPSGSTLVREGRDQTYTVVPDDGYRIADVLVDGNSVGAVESYTFDNVQKRHAIEAVFIEEESPSAGSPFTDVHPDDWFYDDVMFVLEHGLMVGTSDTTFSPNDPITRAQVAVIFYRMAGSPAVTGDSPFTDVENGSGTAWYYDAVLWAQQNGIVAGYGDGTFRPGDNITREQLAVIFYNYARFKGYDVSAASDLSGFTDAGQVSSWALPAMGWIVGSGILNVHEDGILAPRGRRAAHRQPPCSAVSLRAITLSRLPSSPEGTAA